MSDGAYTTTVSTAGLGPEQRRRVDAQIRSEGIPATWAGDGIVIDRAFEARIEGIVADERASGRPAAPGSAATDPASPPAPGATPTDPAAPTAPGTGAGASAPPPPGFVATAPGPLPYAPPPPAPAPYPGSPAYGGYRPAPVTNSNATISLVLGIVAWTVCPIAAIFGVIYGRRAQDEIELSGGTQTGEGMAKVGIILSWVLLGLYGLFILGFVVFFLFLAILGATA